MPPKNSKITKVKNTLPEVEGFEAEVVRIDTNYYKIHIPKFPSHVKLTDRRRKKKKKGEEEGEKSPLIDIPRYTKINGQYLYNGTWNAFQRKRVFDVMHAFIKDSIEKGLKKKKISLSFPINIELEIHTTKWHGGIKVLNGKFIYPIETSKSNSSWDIGNLGFAWSKAIDDCLRDLGIIPDDSIDFVRSTGKITFVPVKDYDKRKLVIILKNH